MIYVIHTESHFLAYNSVIGKTHNNSQLYLGEESPCLIFLQVNSQHACKSHLEENNSSIHNKIIYSPSPTFSRLQVFHFKSQPYLNHHFLKEYQHVKWNA